MEFIKAFLLFVAIMGVVLFVIVYTLYLFFLLLVALRRKIKKQLSKIAAKDAFVALFVSKEMTKEQTRSLKPNTKLLKKVSIIYILSCLAFYGSRVNTYLLQDRPYKEAKAYAIAGEYLFFISGYIC
jgi:hypothetical protein